MQELNTNSLESHLVACVQEYLALYLFENAIFLCERLVAEFPSEANVYLLAACYHRSQQTHRAYHLLKGKIFFDASFVLSSSIPTDAANLIESLSIDRHCTGLQGPQSRYLFALCCFHLGKLTEAEAALLPDNDSSRIPNGAAGLYLLGKIYQLSNRHPVAIAYYRDALQLDPMMWCALEELCALGADHEAQQYINSPSMHPLMCFKGQQDTTPPPYGIDPMTMNTPSLAARQHINPMQSWRTSSHAGPTTDARHSKNSLQTSPEITAGSVMPMSVDTQLQKEVDHRQEFTFQSEATTSASALGDDTPVLVSQMLQGGSGGFTTPSSAEPPSRPPPAPRAHNARPPPSHLSQEISPTMLGTMDAAVTTMRTGPVGGDRKFLDEGKMRKISSKLFVEPASVVSGVHHHHHQQHARYTAAGTAPQLHSLQEDEHAAHENDVLGLAAISIVPGVPHGERSQEGQAAAVSLMQLMGQGLFLLCVFKCKEAIKAFDQLPPHHFNTGWVLMSIGKAYFEMVDYPSSEKFFQQARRVDPYRLKGLEMYSTVLWHMKKEIELSNLAQEAISLDRHSPAAWCVMGNCFSLQKEHETALRFFQRALQLDSTLPYAYTLCGHEYLANEDFEKSITCYRNAIRIDPRHYNAWFGMGHIYYRQEKYNLAEYHFRRAHSINDRSSVLRCYLGMALAKMGKNVEALQALDGAIAADGRNPLARFERASVLASGRAYEAALEELRVLRDIAPSEASVLFHMGKVLKKMGRVQDALEAFCSALDLQPPSADTNLIKGAIDRVAAPDADEEEEM